MSKFRIANDGRRKGPSEEPQSYDKVIMSFGSVPNNMVSQQFGQLYLLSFQHFFLPKASDGSNWFGAVLNCTEVSLSVRLIELGNECRSKTCKNKQLRPA
nr:hypothetical protein Iba_chr12eCG4140 [Ipomoea batatas]